MEVTNNCDEDIVISNEILRDLLSTKNCMIQKYQDDNRMLKVKNNTLNNRLKSIDSWLKVFIVLSLISSFMLIIRTVVDLWK